MRKKFVLVLLVPILALTLISCDADMRSSFADFLGVFGNNVYTEGGLVEANKEEAKAAASTVASLGATGTATVAGGEDYTGFGITVKVPDTVTTVMPPQSKDDREKLNDDLAGIIASSQLSGFKEEMGKKVEDADRKEAVKGTVDTFNALVTELSTGASSEIAEVFGKLSFEVDEDELTEADVLVVQMMVNMVSTTIEALQDIAGEGKEIKDLTEAQIAGNKEKLLDVIDEILFVAEVVGELSGASSLDLLQGIDFGSLLSKGMRGSRDGRDSDDDFDFSMLKHLGPQLVSFFKIKKSGDGYEWKSEDYKRFLREQKIYVGAIDQALAIIQRANYDKTVIRDRVDLFDETSAVVYTIGALLNKLESINGLQDFSRQYIEAFFTGNPTFADGTFSDADEWVEPKVDGKTFEDKMSEVFPNEEAAKPHEDDAKKIISNMFTILRLGGFESLLEDVDEDKIFDDLFGSHD